MFAIAAQYADVKTGRVADVDGLRKVIEGIKGPEAAKALPASGSVSVAQLSEMLSVPATQAPESGNTVGYAARDTSGTMAPYAFDRPGPLAENAVRIRITHCGMCHRWGADTATQQHDQLRQPGSLIRTEVGR